MNFEITECGVFAPSENGSTLIVSFDDAKNPLNALQAMLCAHHLRNFRHALGEVAFEKYIYELAAKTPLLTSKSEIVYPFAALRHG